jgi:Arc/MetJ-type ribon-helix-helix transcriptional regulator
MADSEKITINLSVVDLGKIDLLVEQGYFSSRSDLIRTAIRDKLSNYEGAVSKQISTHSMGVGVFGVTRRELEELRQKGLQKDFNVVGLMVIPKDVTPELALDTIRLIRVFGSLRAPEDVKKALGDRIK